MKKKLLLLNLIFGLSFSTIHSQEIKDALRYSQNELSGTARFTAMSGAFGALGADLSAMNVNPAGSALFNDSQFAITGGNYTVKNSSNYFGTTTSSKENNFSINQVGFTYLYKGSDYEEEDACFNKVAWSVNYEKTNNFNSSLFSAGTSPINSVANYFLSYADGAPLDVLKNLNYIDLDYRDQQAYLGYQGYIINPVTETGNNRLYTSNVRPGGKYYQENIKYSNGYNGKVSANLGLQCTDFLFLGLNLNSHNVDYTQETDFYESNNNPLDSNYRVQKLNFSNSLYTSGSGFSYQIGVITKITDEIRMGFTYESPTKYRLKEKFSQSLTSVSSNNLETLFPDVVNPLVTNIYSYNLRSPESVTGSFAYIFGKSGLISIDYKYKDYSSTRYGSKNDPIFKDLNDEIHWVLHGSNEVRIGAEYKIDGLRLRGGYRFEGSPYKDATVIGNLNSFSAGLGYNFGSIKLDFSYVNTHTKSQEQFFSQGFTEKAKVDTFKNNFAVTLAFDIDDELLELFESWF